MFKCIFILIFLTADGTPGGVNIKEITGDSVRFTYNAAPVDNVAGYIIRIENLEGTAGEDQVPADATDSRMLTFDGLDQATQYRI